MNSPPLPENWPSLVAGYVLADLTDDEVALVEQWLTDYPEVAAELAALQSTWDSLPAVLPSVAPPPRLRDRIMAAGAAPALGPAPAAAGTSAGPTPLAPVGQPDTAALPMGVSPRRFPWGKLGLALGWIATGLALALTWQENQRLRLALRQQDAIVASFSQPANHLYTLAGTPAAPQANARLVVDPADQTALIVTTDLPTLGADQVYRLWALADSDPVFCGEFNPSALQATSQWTLPNATCAANPVQMLITAEKATDPPVPAGSLVLQSQS